MSDERLLWAKASPSYKSLWHHMIDSGFCAARLAEDPRFSLRHAVARSLF